MTWAKNLSSDGTSLIVNGFYSVRRSRHHLHFKRLPGSPGILRVDKFEIRGLR
jgi:hypothetical protein